MYGWGMNSINWQLVMAFAWLEKYADAWQVLSFQRRVVIAVTDSVKERV